MRPRSTSARALRTTVLAAALLSLTVRPVFSQNGSGSYGAPFLKIPVGARLMSSPDVVAGMRPDASLLYSNPAFLSGLQNSELFVSSSRWLGDLSFTSMGAAVPVGKGTVLGVGTTLLYSGGLEGYDDALNVVSEESFYDFGLDVAISHQFGSGFSAAAGMTYVREHVLPEDGSGYAFNLGGSYWRGANMIHAAFRDLGGAVDFASDSWQIAPEGIAGGGHIFDSHVGQFFAGMQVASSDAYGTRARLGVDYAINPMFTLRTGFNDNFDETQSGSSFNAGFGMKYGTFAIEYAYTPQEYFASAHTFSLLYSFDASTQGGHPGATVPPGDLSPPIPDAPPVRVSHPGAGPYLLVAGAHASIESARSEAHALELLKIPAEVDNEGPRFRVVIGRFTSFGDADRVRNRYRHNGHVFQIISR